MPKNLLRISLSVAVLLVLWLFHRQRRQRQAIWRQIIAELADFKKQHFDVLQHCVSAIQELRQAIAEMSQLSKRAAQEAVIVDAAAPSGGSVSRNLSITREGSPVSEQNLMMSSVSEHILQQHQPLTTSTHINDLTNYQIRSGTSMNTSALLPSHSPTVAASSAAPVKDFLAQQQLLDHVKQKLLRRVKIFAELPNAFFDLVAEHLTHLTVPAGVDIVTKGEYGETMYFIASGHVHVVIGKKVVREMADGEFFGELALLDGGLRTATCVAVVECQLFSLSRDAFLVAMHEFPAARMAMEREKIIRLVEGDFTEKERKMPEIREQIKETIETRLREYAAMQSTKMQFHLQNQIGQGASGTVYSAINAVNGKPLAVKKILKGSGLSQKGRLAIEQESGLMQTLRHPNVVQGYGIQIDDEALYVLMELLPLGSLANLCANGGPMAEATVQAYTRQMLSGLHYLHSRGVLHRDLKPANILISESGTVKLADLGICKIGAVAAEHQSVTLVGTPAYLSPDAINGRYSIGSDLWALGCTVLELITGSPPFAEKNFDIPTQLLFYIANNNAAPTIPPAANYTTDEASGTISVQLHNFLSKLLSADPRDRGDCAELLQHPWLTSTEIPTEPAFSDCSSGLDATYGSNTTRGQTATVTVDGVTGEYYRQSTNSILNA